MGCICENKETKYGIFICPICKKESGFDKWQKRGDKWIFHRDNAWYSSLNGYPYSKDEDCWKKTGGSSAEQWDSDTWICGICRYGTHTFFDYIPDYKGTKEYELSREKRKNDFLTKELINNKMDKIILNKEADIYNSILIKQQRKIEQLNGQIRIMEKKMIREDDIIVINFKSTDNRVNKRMECKSSDLFVTAEKKLYENYPQYRNTNNIFTANGKSVKRFLSLEENKIKNSDIILLNVC